MAQNYNVITELIKIGNREIPYIHKGVFPPPFITCDDAVWSWKCKSDLLFPVVPECTGPILPPSHPSPTRLPSPSSGAVGSTEVGGQAHGIMGRGQRLQGEGERGTVHGTQGPHVVSGCNQTAHQPEHSPGGWAATLPRAWGGALWRPTGAAQVQVVPRERYSPPPSQHPFPTPSSVPFLPSSLAAKSEPAAEKDKREPHLSKPVSQNQKDLVDDHVSGLGDIHCPLLLPYRERHFHYTPWEGRIWKKHSDFLLLSSVLDLTYWHIWKKK